MRNWEVGKVVSVKAFLGVPGYFLAVNTLLHKNIPKKSKNTKDCILFVQFFEEKEHIKNFVKAFQQILTDLVAA